MKALRGLAIAALTAAAVAAAGCSRDAAITGVTGTAPRHVDTRAAERVAVARAAERLLPQTIEPIGTVRARQQSVLAARIVATVVAVHVREGQRVRAGDVVVTLDDRDLAADLRRAQAVVREAHQALEETDRALAAAARAVDAARAQQELAAATLARYAALAARGMIARQQHAEVATQARATAADVARLEETRRALLARREQALSRIEQAESDVTRARVAGGHARVLAPVDGVVVSKTVEVGNLAAPGVALVTVETERYRLEATVQESDMRHVRVGSRAVVAIDALGTEREGAVEEIVPAADPASRTFLVKLDAGADPRLRSGLYGRARFVVGERRAIVVPRAAIVQRGQLELVFVVEGGRTARLRLVKTGKPVDGAVEILSGVAEGEPIVTDGADRLADGAAVESPA